MAFRISDDCVGCGACKSKCPWGAIFGEKKKKHVIEPTICQECATCWFLCPRCAVEDACGTRREKSQKSRVPKANISPSMCVGCRNCLLNCERGAISYQKGVLLGRCHVDDSVCVGCGGCMSYCANGCINLE